MLPFHPGCLCANRSMKSRAKGLYSLLLLIVAGLFFTGCAEEQSRYVRDGREYGITGGSFRGRWWNYYERGRSFSDGKFYREAIADFEKAIEGREKDQWRTRTYGMHFVDYFPHRELGIVYYHLKDYDKAIAELMESVENAPSAKGYYFLNKARSSKITRESLDRSAPRLDIQAGTIQEITREFTRIVAGTATDDTYIAGIRVGGQQIPMELAMPKKYSVPRFRFQKVKIPSRSRPPTWRDEPRKNTSVFTVTGADRR